MDARRAIMKRYELLRCCKGTQNGINDEKMWITAKILQKVLVITNKYLTLHRWL